MDLQSVIAFNMAMSSMVSIENEWVLELESLELAKDYQIICKQKTKLNKTTSSEREISFGVLQGSMLGLLIFTRYTNNLKDWLQTDTL